jgi:RNA recognition motif-containing protein
MFRVYVGNLPYRVRGEELKEFFGSAGNVTDAIVPLTEDQRSKGFGFVEFGDEESFKKALAMDGQQMEGRPLRINEARPREDRGGDRGGNRPAPAQDAPASDVSDAPAEDAGDMPAADDAAEDKE